MRSCVRILVLCLFGVHAFAQNAAVIRSNSFEIGPFFGSSYGIDQFRVMGGGNLTYAINSRILPYVEYSYFPGIGRVDTRTFSTGNTVTYRYAVPLSDFHGGVHIRFPIRESKIVPYGVFGLGVLKSFDRTVDATFTDAAGLNHISLPVKGRNDFAVNFGGGFRFYLSQRYGLRLEAKAYKPTGAFPDVFGKVEFGFFIQLH